MPEGSIILIGFGLMLAVSVGVAYYCVQLGRKYKRIESDMRCIHDGVEQNVMEIVYDRNDWFRRSVRLHRGTYPYYEDVLISEVRAVR